MKEMEVVAVEVLRVFIIQTVKGFGGPIEAWSRNGDATESAALSNELEWPIEAEPFHRSQGGQSVKTSPAPSSFTGAKRRLLTLWSVGI